MGLEPTVQIAARVPEKVADELERIARDDDRTVSYVIRQALKAHIAANPKQKAKAS